MENQSTIKPGQKDKIATFIFSLKGNKLILAVIICIAIVMLPVFFAYIDGNIINPDLTIDVLRDYPNLIFYLVGFPTMLVTAILYANKLPEVLTQLKENEIIRTNDVYWEKFKNRANEIYSKWYYTKGPQIIALIVTIYLFIIFRDPKNHIWYSLKTDEYLYLAGWAQLIVYYVTFYTFSLSLLNIFASYRILKVLFSSNKIMVQPLHPDNCGGLAPLGALSRTLNIGIILIGVIVALNIYHNYVHFGRDLTDYLQISIILGYLISAYIIFFLPMHAAHKPMKEAKEEELNLIHHYINNINKKLKRDFEQFNNIDSEALENFQNAKEIYDVTSQMPVYPYNFKTILSFITSVFFPIAYYIIQEFLGI